MSVHKREIILSICGLLIILLFLLSSCRKNENLSQISGSEDNPLFNLSEKDALDISIDDIQLLLDTPVKELDDFFKITANDKTEWMMGITSYPAMRGVSFSYGYHNDEYLNSVLLWYLDDFENSKGKDFPLGYTIDEIIEMQEWGETTIDEFLYAAGYSGDEATPLKALNYIKNGIAFSFRIDYNNVFRSEDEQESIIKLIVISKYPTSTFIDEGSTEMRHIDGVLFVEPFPATYHSLPAEDSTDIVERLVAGDFSEVRLTNGTLIDEYTKELLEKLIAMMDGETCEHE